MRISKTLQQITNVARKAAPLAIAFTCFSLTNGNLVAQQWTALKELPPLNYYPSTGGFIRNSAAATGPDGKVYVVGGEQQTANGPLVVTTVNRYDPIINQWATQPAIPALNMPRKNHAAVTGCDGKIYAIGGNTYSQGHGSPTASVETYDPRTGAPWTMLPTTAWLVQSWDHLVGTVGGDCNIYVFTTDSAYPTVQMQMLNTVTMRWTLAPTGFTEPFLHGALSAHNGNVYVLGPNGTHFLNPATPPWNNSMGPLFNSGVFASTVGGVDGKFYFMGQDPAGAFSAQPPNLPISPLPLMNFGQPNNSGDWIGINGRSYGTAATAEGQVISINGLRDQYAGIPNSPAASNVEAYGPLKAGLGPYKVWWQFNNSTATGDFPTLHKNDDPTACLFSSGTSRRVAGRVGYAFLLDGLSSLPVRSPSCADFAIANQSFTIEFWMNHNGSASSTVQSILDKRSAESAGFGYHVALYQGRIAFQMANGMNQNFWTPAGSPIIPANQWTHVAITVDGPNKQGRIWFNGALALNFTPLQGSLSSPATSLNIGGHNFGGQSFQGQLDELTMYDRALTFQEVRSVFLAGAQGKF